MPPETGYLKTNLSFSGFSGFSELRQRKFTSDLDSSGQNTPIKQGP